MEFDSILNVTRLILYPFCIFFFSLQGVFFLSLHKEYTGLYWSLASLFLLLLAVLAFPVISPRLVFKALYTTSLVCVALFLYRVLKIHWQHRRLRKLVYKGKYDDSESELHA